MKNQYLIIRMKAADLYNNRFLMRGFDRKRIDQVIGIVVVVADEHSTSLKDNMYHLSRVGVEMLVSDTQQKHARLFWDDEDRRVIQDGKTLLPADLRKTIDSMLNNRLYHTVDTQIPEAFRECHTVFDIPAVTEMRERINKRLRDSQKKDVLDKFTVEELLQHLKKRTGAKITFEL